MARFLSLILICVISNSLLAQNKPDTVLENQVFIKINQYRTQRGLPPFKKMPIVAQQAQEHSISMAMGKTAFSHDGFSIRIQKVRSQLSGVMGAAENVAMGTVSLDEIIRSWINSEGHKENILGNYTHTGVGVAKSTDGSLYYTQIFIVYKP
jgi:uncharacterized protein YkwD